MNHKHVEIDLDKNLFDQILVSIADEYEVNIKRIARMAKQNGTFYFTVIADNYLLLEIELTPLKNDTYLLLHGLPAFESSVTAY